MDFGAVLKFAVDQGASDLHLQAGSPPVLRITGQMRPATAPPTTHEELVEFLTSIAPHDRKNDIVGSARVGLDFSYDLPEVARFRCSAYMAMGKLGIVLRVIRTKIPVLEDLLLPPVVKDIAKAMNGLVLLTGTTGSGKSTTLAAMIDLINTDQRVKIITIEDPIEFIHPPKKAMVSQLELGADTPSFEQALRQALRQDPDVILVGELRDVETLRMALRAADTGHQVFATVHSARAAQTIERIVAMFPPAEQNILMSQLSHSIEAIISQRLVVTREGKRRPAVEVLRGGPAAEKFILEGRLNELSAYVETGGLGMQTFDQHLAAMYKEGIIAGTEALRHANRPESLAVAMRGITLR